MNKNSKDGEEIRAHILEYLKAHEVTHANVSIRELADKFDKSTSVINFHLDKLVEANKIKRAKTIARSIQIVKNEQ